MASVFQEKRKEFLLNLSWKPLMTTMGAAAVVLSIASFWTTWHGLADFTGEPIRSLIITLGVQTLMLALALLIGNIAATEAVTAPVQAAGSKTRRAPRQGSGMEPATAGALFMVAAFAFLVALFQFKAFGGLALIGIVAMAILVAVIIVARRHVIIALAFMLTMTVSVFFSFDALYTAISPEEKRAREALVVARSEVQDIFGTLGKTFADERKELQDTLIESDTWRDFSTRLASVQTVATEADSVLEAIATERQAARDAELKSRRDNFEFLQKSVPALEQEKGQIDGRIKQIEADRAPVAERADEMRRRYETLRTQVEAGQIELKSEIGDGQGVRNRGCGPKCREIKERNRPVESQAARERTALDIEEKRLKEIDGELATLRKRLGAIEPELDRRKREAAAAESRVKQAESDGGVPEAGASVDVTSLAGFNVALKTFPEKPTSDGFRTLVAQCDGILSTMKGLDQLKSRTASLDCDPKGFSSDITLFLARTNAMDSFNAECTREAVSEIAKVPSAAASAEALQALPTAQERALAAENQTRLRNKAFAQLLDAGNKCLSFAYKASAGSAEAQRDRMDVLALSIDPEAHRFQRNLAVLDRGDKTAFLAAIIALTIDGLVFISGLYWARTSIAPIVRRGEPSPQEGKDIIDVNLDVDPRIYGTEPAGVLNAKTFLKYLQRDFAGYRDVPQNEKGRFSGVVDLRTVSGADRPRVHKVLDVGKFCEPVDGARDCFLVERRLVDYLNEQIWKWQKMNPSALTAGDDDGAPGFDDAAADDGWGFGSSKRTWPSDGDLANDDAELDEFFGLETPEAAKNGKANGAAEPVRPRPTPVNGKSVADAIDEDPALERTAARNRQRRGWPFG